MKFTRCRTLTRVPLLHQRTQPPRQRGCHPGCSRRRRWQTRRGTSVTYGLAKGTPECKLCLKGQAAMHVQRPLRIWHVTTLSNSLTFRKLAIHEGGGLPLAFAIFCSVCAPVGTQLMDSRAEGRRMNHATPLWESFTSFCGFHISWYGNQEACLVRGEKATTVCPLMHSDLLRV